MHGFERDTRVCCEWYRFESFLALESKRMDTVPGMNEWMAIERASEGANEDMRKTNLAFLLHVTGDGKSCGMEWQVGVVCILWLSSEGHFNGV